MLKRVQKLAQSYGIVIYREPNAYHLAMDYPVSDRPRYGYKTPPHPLIATAIEARRGEFESFLRDISALRPIVDSISYEAADPALPYWNNGWFPPRDGAAIMHFVLQNKPVYFMEIGSGNSTKFARLAIERGGLSTKVVSIDPEPRAEINALCDEIVRTGLEDVDLKVFDRLGPGDILSFDGSHRCFTDSDVTVFFLDVLPRLPAGVIVHVHDIHWPKDYPPVWGRRFYNEQYLLGQLLVLAGDRIEILLANAFIDQDPELREVAASALPVDQSRITNFEQGIGPVGFWFRLQRQLHRGCR